MRLLLAALALSVVPACMMPHEDDPPPIANPCPPPEEALSLKDGPYGSGVTPSTEVDVYPSYKSDYPKRLVFERATSTARIEYVHEDKTVVEKWKVLSLTKPIEGACSTQGHERTNLQLAGITIDGVMGDISRYAGLTKVTLMAGASLHYEFSGRDLTVEYRHGFSPIFSSPCPFHRPADGTACDETSICAYDLEGENCTTRCASGKWQSFSCGK